MAFVIANMAIDENPVQVLKKCHIKLFRQPQTFVNRLCPSTLSTPFDNQPHVRNSREYCDRVLESRFLQKETKAHRSARTKYIYSKLKTIVVSTFIQILWFLVIGAWKHKLLVTEWNAGMKTLSSPSRSGVTLAFYM